MTAKEAIVQLMQGSEPKTLAEINIALRWRKIYVSETSISARLRELRSEGYDVMLHTVKWGTPSQKRRAPAYTIYQAF